MAASPAFSKWKALRHFREAFHSVVPKRWCLFFLSLTSFHPHPRMNSRSQGSKRSQAVDGSRSGTRGNKQGGGSTGTERRGRAGGNRPNSPESQMQGGRGTQTTRRDQNTRYTEDSIANHGNRSNSNLERTRGTSQESRTDDPYNQEPTSAQSRDSSNIERDRPRDPESHKRKISEAITEGLASSFNSNKKARTEYLLYILAFIDIANIVLYRAQSVAYGFHRKARGLLRSLGPFMDIESIFIEGNRLAAKQDKQDAAANGDTTSEVSSQ